MTRLEEVVADCARELESVEEDLAENGLTDIRERVTSVRATLVEAGIDDAIGRDQKE